MCEDFPYMGRLPTSGQTSYIWYIFPYVGSLTRIWEVFPYVANLPLYGKSSHVWDDSHTD
jgi:hypothetical protein